MGLTRHFYREDEVKASFFNCLVNRRVEEGIFWATELFDSFLGEEILPIFKRAWLLSVGPEYRKGFIQLVGLEEEAEVYQVLQNFMSLPKDASVFTLLVRGASCESQPDRLCRKPCIVRVGLDNVDKAAWRAISQRKPLLALCLLRTRWTWALFEEDEYLAALRAEDTWEARAAAMIYACSSKKEKGITQKPVYCRDDWTALEGRRARRKFAVRSVAILWGTARATTSSEAELLDIEPALQGSAYWEEVAKDMGGWEKIKKNSAVRETFYELYFPDDIPDEWSLEERRKSHDRGIAEGQQAKYWKCLFWNKPSFGLVVFTHEAIRGCKWDFASFEEAYSSGQGRWTAAQRTWLLAPVQKKLQVINLNESIRIVPDEKTG
jgi:hypothetical protein